MSLFDIIGPIMVGPSSSHTAGAARIGYVVRQIMGEEIAKAQIDLYGSFLATGKGHGTDKALVAGLLGMKEDDYRIPKSFEIAKEKNMEIAFGEAFLSEAHPNSVQIHATGVSGKERTIEAASVGGGAIRINRIDDIETNFTGDYPTLICRHEDKPGMTMKVIAKMNDLDINIANLMLTKDLKRKGTAVMVIEFDEAVPFSIIDEIREWPDIIRVIYLEKEDVKPTAHTMEKLAEYLGKKEGKARKAGE